jgi:DNA-binding NarL/FixJ family response regulator
MTTVLLIDDHALFREGIRRLLSEHGFTIVGQGDDGRDAVRLYGELRPDMVLMDLTMPYVGGLEATRLIKAEHPDARVVILTASETEADLFDAVKSGAHGYLLKGYSPENVVVLLQAAAEGTPALTPDLANKILSEFARMASEITPTSPSEPSASLEVRGLVEPLTDREQEVLKHLVTGASNREIAARLIVTENTVKYHLKNILQKLHLSNRAQVVAYALRGKQGGGNGEG